MSNSPIDLLYEKYIKTAQIMSRMNYIPAMAVGEILLLLILYSGGMMLAVFNLPLQGIPLIMHLYGAILVAILALGILAAAVRYKDKGAIIISLLNIISILFAAFAGSFYFGGVIDVTFLLEMGMGFVFAVVTASGCLIYAIRRGE
ncbi:hypothetical protein [Saccharolobus caldissimus]|uniref:Uncharacterized protein n=1 Tax=Saccharolobus caldissimus TaxID=1702097 RepID=A0AAQ4CU24_9CREN|nr:hypothetical protein [Saccharolobus caldissimus]BDB99305.1 hypothetical protein SACC_23220 [Saccharolobus caldissimus]